MTDDTVVCSKRQKVEKQYQILQLKSADREVELVETAHDGWIAAICEAD